MKKLSHRKQIILSLAVTLILGCLLSGAVFSKTNGPAQETESQPAESSAGRGESSQVITQHETGLVEEKSLDDLVGESSLIVRGKVEASSVIQVESPQGGVTNFTDYSVAVTETIRGEEQEQVTVRVRGGLTGNLNVVNEDSPELLPEGKYLFFLYQPGMGGGFNTEGDYYYITGVYQGAYHLEAEAGQPAVARAFGGGETTQAEQLTANIEMLSDEKPLEPDQNKKVFLENLQNNLESGFITQGEYDEILAGAGEYAQVIAGA